MPASGEKIHCVYLYADTDREWNTSNWRCHLLSNAINYRNDKDPKRFPHTARMIQMQSAMDFHHPAIQRALGEADILVFQRNVIDEVVYDAMDYWRALGKIVLVDLDDHYPGIPPSNPAFPYWIQNVGELDPPPVERLKKGLEHADALISPNQLILKDWEKVVPGYFWPNYPAQKDYENLPRKEYGAPDYLFTYINKGIEDKQELVAAERPNSAGQIVISWGGSISHVDSFVYSGVLDGLARLMEEDERVVFRFCGNENRLDFLLAKLPEGRVIRQGGVSPYDWPKVVATADIGIAPMDMRPVTSHTETENEGYSYDERRSWLKLVEYVCAGVPFVATDCFPYQEFRSKGKLIENGADNWYNALKAQVGSLYNLKQIAKKNRTWAMKRYTQEANAEKLIKLYIRIGEETQARRGLRMPDVLYVGEVAKDYKTPDGFDEQIANLPPLEDGGDPLGAGHQAPWHGEVSRIAQHWADEFNLDYMGIPLDRTIEYSVLSRLNQAYSEAHDSD